MATTPANVSASQPQQLPLFYNSLVPLSSQFHPTHGLKPREEFNFAKVTHAIPVTVDEFAIAQRFYPIVFGLGDNPAPLALVGLTEGQNLYIGEDGLWQSGAYVPAFVRRYPFMLARLQENSEELSLCFDDSANQLSADATDKLFDGAEPTDTTKSVLAFCEQFEQAIARTRGFMDELAKLDLLIDGEVTIQQPNMPEPAIYRGFRMVAEEKLQNIRGDQARKMVQNGMMGLIYAHLFGLAQIGNLFERQTAQAAELAAK
ncbi:SapC family protein [Glacieibacterium sp.]|uniref:SapC family protein n=1 Tax=Glacieibacterium sp. TaxID=2860237 RepID=UPI003B003F36